MYLFAILYVLTGVLRPGMTLTATSYGTTCGYPNGSLVARAGGGVAPYSFSLNGGAAQSDSNFVDLDTGKYVVSATDATGLTVTYTVHIANLYPQPSMAYTFTYGSDCQATDATITLHARDGTPPYQFSFDNLHYQDDSTFVNLAAGRYTVFARDSNGCIFDRVTAIVNECNFAFNYFLTEPGCTGSDGGIKIVRSPGLGFPPFRFSLDGGAVTDDSVFTGLAAGTYQMAITDMTNATNLWGFNLYADCVSLTARVTPPCSANPPGITLVAFGGTTPLQYSLDGVHFQFGNTFGEVVPGDYNVVVKDALGNTAYASVVVYPATVALTLGMGPPVTDCAGAPVALPVTSNGDTFSWMPTAGLSSASVLQPSAAPAATTMYHLTVTKGVCVRTDSVLVTVDPGPVAHALGDTTICDGGTALLRASATGTGPFVYTWSGGTGPTGSGGFVSPAASTTYTLVASDAYGCPSPGDPIRVTVTPPAVLSVVSDTNLVLGQPLQLDARDVNGAGFVNFTWMPPDGLSNPYIADPVALPALGTVTYTVTAHTAAGCLGTASVAIKVFADANIYVPSAFTPNGDGQNDVLRAIPVGIKSFGVFMVFNRWGQTVFRSSDPLQGWDGRTAPTGVYVWSVTGIDLGGQVIRRQGTVLLIR
ncbi:MAG TPA: gliding motility-associated C-terminal domain-containing protein [Dinghuibacter sp.]|uniref:T9SS type B sorting domain-containing protein n=1 Tax=Dinghuibacter sp. TaxID=2024697 RepID=UPI002C2DB5B4|nr:gliding motility-associated C-terminal domain-containing protein [Dinghuibacter sp.]HTJ14318.1 gliding motility-associated C-terminal domain-containing protein [Dinghuibacter sp.]